MKHSTSVPIKIRGIRGRLENTDVQFRLRDNLRDSPSELSDGESTLLTIELLSLPEKFVGDDLLIEVTFDVSGTEYDSKVLKISVQNQVPLPNLLMDSPFIYGRPITANEIEDHFFGRGKEQDALFESIRDGQQRIRYVEGIRRTGKTSLLRSCEHEIRKRGLPYHAVYVSVASARGASDAGTIFFNIASTIAMALNQGLNVPSREHCRDNLPKAYSDFTEMIARTFPNQRVLAMVDDFQALVERGESALKSNVALADGILGLLNTIWEHSDPSARLVWILAGHRSFGQFRRMLPGALPWGVIRSLPIDFLNIAAVAEIVETPLKNSGFLVPPETITRLHLQTSGHPECVQQIAELMLSRASAERRSVLTPNDADNASNDLANFTDDSFAETWYPLLELTIEQKVLIGSFINAVSLGQRIEPYRLAAGNQITPPIKTALDDLSARKIIDIDGSGTIGIKARVLELWLRRAVPRMMADGSGFGVHGSSAIFIDVANLTGGTGRSVISELDTELGEGQPGQFTLATVLDRIIKFAQSVTPAPIAARWVANYPLASPAVVECNAKDFWVLNVPKDLAVKGSDDVILREKISEVEQQQSTVNHFVIVTGDKDFRLTADRLCSSGKFVHIVSRSRALSHPSTQYSYDSMAKQFPKRFTVTRLEELLRDVSR